MARGGERNGQTLGKQIVGIRVIRDDGDPYNFGTAFVRQFLVIQLLFGVIGGSSSASPSSSTTCGRCGTRPTGPCTT